MFRGILVVLGLVLVLSGCTTIGSQQMTYLGDATQSATVVGKATHCDFAGFGVTANGFADEYKYALSDAFRNAPKGTTKLVNLKAFKAPSSWPIFAGIGLYVLGSALVTSSRGSNASLGLGVLVTTAGTALTLVNTYDFVLVAESGSSD